ncbi:poly-alpha-2,8 sialosyl sialyltransferase [Escherichia coli]|nr:poly-alpha-2,8 sialosyl sialyltransferase [Escherichia coli]EJC7305456.1 poly-alpha-2,8 sialosyl sialyltransferase [Escherichia coli]ELO7612081.1 poly-alpha-2,8 sialosyl sialyltransferase [Escherichia coli]
MIFDASLKKLRKLFVNPIGFFRDSWFFNSKNKAEELLSPLKIKSKNIFIVAHLGQLKKAELFIQKFSRRSNFLIVLATKKNTEMPRLILEQMNKKLFSSYKLLFIPTEPNTFSLKKVIWFYNVYKYIVLNSKAKDAYFMSYAQHYAIFIWLFKKNNIRCSLIEEGTGTYKTEKKKPLVNINFYSWIINSIILFHYPDLKFENVYGTFPNLLKEKFDAKKIFEFKTIPLVKSSTRMDNLIHKYRITRDDIIYVSQRYWIDNELYAHLLISTLMRIDKSDNARVFIKPHPKETKKYINAIQGEINKAKRRDIIIIVEKDFLIESIIKKCKIKHLIGLASSSLVYAPLVYKECKTYSIAPIIIKLCNNEKSQKGINTLRLHFDILKNFDNVKILSDDITSPSLHDKRIFLGE